MTTETGTKKRKDREGGWRRWAGRGVRCWTLCLLVAALSLPAGARKKKGEAPPLCSVSIRVLRESDERPVRYAGVVLQSLRTDGSPDGDAYELKTSTEGRVAMPDIPCGGLRVQVIARRLRTFGEDFQLGPATGEIVIHMKPPAGQVSAY